MSWLRRSHLCFENGKSRTCISPAVTASRSTEFHVVRPRTDRADARYLVHFLRQDRIRRHVREPNDGQRRTAPRSRATSSPGSVSRCHPSPSSGGLRRSWTKRTRCGPSAAPPSPNSTPSPNPSSSTCSATPPRIRRGGRMRTLDELGAEFRDGTIGRKLLKTIGRNQRCEFANVHRQAHIDLSGFETGPGHGRGDSAATTSRWRLPVRSHKWESRLRWTVCSSLIVVRSFCWALRSTS